jgi:hypothetical protein
MAKLISSLEQSQIRTFVGGLISIDLQASLCAYAQSKRISGNCKAILLLIDITDRFSDKKTPISLKIEGETKVPPLTIGMLICNSKQGYGYK